MHTTPVETSTLKGQVANKLNQAECFSALCRGSPTGDPLRVASVGISIKCAEVLHSTQEKLTALEGHPERICGVATMYQKLLPVLELETKKATAFTELGLQ